MATRAHKPAKRKTVASRKKTRTRIKPTLFTFYCTRKKPGEADPPSKNLKKGSKVVLLADGTSVTLDFRPYAGSPFKSRRARISLADDVPKLETIGEKDDIFEYDVWCPSRKGKVTPKMIVDP